eukprot:scaffold1143_cov107-Isochrysis_galbana.AAC.8
MGRHRVWRRGAKRRNKSNAQLAKLLGGERAAVGPWAPSTACVCQYAYGDEAGAESLVGRRQ